MVERTQELNIMTRDGIHVDGINTDILHVSDFFRLMLECTEDSDERIVVDLEFVTFNKVLDWMKEHHAHVEAGTIEVFDEDDAKDSECIPKKDKQFLRDILQQQNLDAVCEIIKAANYLQIGPLKDAGIRTIANMLKSQTREEMLTIMELQSDLTKEEVEKIRLQNEWFEER